MLRRSFSIVLWFTVLVIPTLTFAGMENARFALHRIPVPAKTGGLCDVQTPNSNGITCADYSLTAPVPGASFVYLVVGQGGTEGIAAVSCGIDYDGRVGTHLGIDPSFVTWTLCATTNFKNAGDFGYWPNPKGGNRIAWSMERCQTEMIGSYGVHAVAGVLYVYAYSEDVLRLTPNNNLYSGSELVIGDCSGDPPNGIPNVITDLLLIYPPELHGLLVGRVHFGGDGSEGYTPCGVVAANRTSWGKLKGIYRH